MSRRNWSRVARLERAVEDRKPMAPWVVLFPGQEPPEGHKGNVVRIRVIDASKPGGAA